MLRHLKRPRKNNPYTKYIRAFGEEKTAQEWGFDPRCVHRDGNLVAGRVRTGVPPEVAITTPRFLSTPSGTKTGNYENPVSNEEYADAMERPVTAYGETKSIGEWLEDSRCEWDSAMAIAKRLDAGFPGPVALRQRPKVSGRLLEAFGEFKTMSAWAQDPRCLYRAADLRRRLARGMSFERALSEPMGFVEVAKAKRYQVGGETYIAFGESKNLRDWAGDSRCSVNVDILRRRIRDGWEVERALTSPFSGSAQEAR